MSAGYFPLPLAELNFQNQLFMGLVGLPILACLVFLCCLPFREAFRSKPCTCNEGRTGYGTLAVCPCASSSNSLGAHNASSTLSSMSVTSSPSSTFSSASPSTSFRRPCSVSVIIHSPETTTDASKSVEGKSVSDIETLDV